MSDCPIVSTGCQRLEILQQTSQLSRRVRICADTATPRLPKEALEGQAHWGRWAWRLSDPWALAAKATKMFSDVFPDVRPLQTLLAGWLLPAPHISTEVAVAVEALQCICVHACKNILCHEATFTLSSKLSLLYSMCFTSHQQMYGKAQGVCCIAECPGYHHAGESYAAWPDTDELLDDLRYGVGHCRAPGAVDSPDGHLLPSSIAWFDAHQSCPCR